MQADEQLIDQLDNGVDDRERTGLWGQRAIVFDDAAFSLHEPSRYACAPDVDSHSV
jgi:hypothetical protein